MDITLAGPFFVFFFRRPTVRRARKIAAGRIARYTLPIKTGRFYTGPISQTDLKTQLFNIQPDDDENYPPTVDRSGKRNGTLASLLAHKKQQIH